MESWQATYLGMRELPRELSAFELRAFFTFSRTERDAVEARRGTALKLGLALHRFFAHERASARCRSNRTVGALAPFGHGA